MDDRPERAQASGPRSGDDSAVPEPVGPDFVPPAVVSPDATGPDASRPARPAATSEHRRPFHRELPFLVVLALGLVILLKAFVVQAFYIPSGSMENTLAVGDRVLVDEVSYRFHPVRRGDVVVFDGSDSWTVPDTDTVGGEPPTNPVLRVVHGLGSALGLTAPSNKIYIKRAIGLPGDRVACCDPTGHVTVNGVALDESPYLHPGNVPSTTTFDVQVPAGRLFFLGDHRDSSADSRVHLDVANGTIPANRVVGRAFVVIWPLGHWATLGPPAGLGAASALGAAVPLLLRRRRRWRLRL